MFANRPGDLVQSQVESYQRLKKWYLMPPCLTLSIIRYGSRVKWSNPGKGVAPSPTPWCSKLSKREPSGYPRLWSPTTHTHIYLCISTHTHTHIHAYIHIYIYIYIYTYSYTYIYVYIYMCVCVCVCVCARACVCVCVCVSRKIEKQSKQKRRIYCEGKSTLNVSLFMNLHQDFRMVIPTVD